ncbi:MAG: hypothetical protein IPL46_20155 [Saprospiraceae bacterium]|nr:hypothetical protein [Saprospiraceae bacterium]
MEKTLRQDSWWHYPAFILFGLTSFLVYGLWSALQADFYWYSAGGTGFGGYLAPFYSPLLFIKEGVEGAAPMSHSLFGAWPAWWPEWIPPSPSLLILAVPGDLSIYLLLLPKSLLPGIYRDATCMCSRCLTPHGKIGLQGRDWFDANPEYPPVHDVFCHVIHPGIFL